LLTSGQRLRITPHIFQLYEDLEKRLYKVMKRRFSSLQWLTTENRRRDMLHSIDCYS